MTEPTLRLAHRGDHRQWIENTADALVGACALPGIDGVEFDVRMSADGEPVVLHDESLLRTFGLSVVAGAAAAVDLIRVGVPHLVDVLALLPPDVFLDIELKEPPTPATFDAIVRARGTSLRRAVVSSFDPPTVAEVRARQPGWACWLNAVTLDRWSIAAAQAAGAAGVAAQWASIGADSVAEATVVGLAVAAWTIRRRPTRTRLERLGITATMVEGFALDPEPG